MKSTVTTYAYFHVLPRWVKMMLAAWKSHFFDEVTPPGNNGHEMAREAKIGLQPG